MVSDLGFRLASVLTARVVGLFAKASLLKHPGQGMEDTLFPRSSPLRCSFRHHLLHRLLWGKGVGRRNRGTRPNSEDSLAVSAVSACLCVLAAFNVTCQDGEGRDGAVSFSTDLCIVAPCTIKSRNWFGDRLLVVPHSQLASYLHHTSRHLKLPALDPSPPFKPIRDSFRFRS